MEKNKFKKEKSDFKEILFSQFVSIGGGIIAGALLIIWADEILLIPGMLILIPGFLELRESISGTLSARISSGLFVGLIKKKGMSKSQIIRGNVLASFILAVIISLVLGLMTFGFNKLFFGIMLPEIIFIPLIAGILVNLIEIPLTTYFTFYFFRKGYDPGNIMGPFISTTGDVISIVALLIAIVLI